MPNYGKRPVRLPSFPGGRTSLPFVCKLLSDGVSAVLCALVFLHEPMGALERLGAMLIIGGAAIGSVPKRAPRLSGRRNRRESRFDRGESSCFLVRGFLHERPNGAFCFVVSFG